MANLIAAIATALSIIIPILRIIGDAIKEYRDRNKTPANKRIESLEAGLTTAEQLIECLEENRKLLEQLSEARLD